ncbi:MAG: SurA N-terminal domain-containing protein [Nitrospirota bacterium]|nr:SurA N-terminal domain-containing protein [Nitrospirota bacterium]
MTWRRGKRDRPWTGLLAAVAAVAQLLIAAPAGAELVDRVIAAVNNDVITRSELRQAVMFNLSLSGGSEAGRKVEAETLEGLINRKLLLQEAYRLRYVEVTDQDAAEEVKKLRARLGTEQAFQDLLERTGMTGDRLARLLGERLLVERFIDKKIGIFARVNRDEVEQYYREHGTEFSGKRFPEVQKQITAFLTQQKTLQQLDLYIAELRGRADIRINGMEE